jgi:hypothetical protein
MQVMASLEALDRPLGPGPEDPVGVHMQSVLETDDGATVVAGLQRASGARRRREGERDEKRDDELS